jgi:hypothetical protein
MSTFVAKEGIAMFATNGSTPRGARRVRIVALVAILGLTGSLAATMAVGAAPADGDGGRPVPAVVSPVSDAEFDTWFTGGELPAPADEVDGDMAPMVDPVEDEDLS